MHAKFGSYLVLQLKYDEKDFCADAIEAVAQPYPLQTMDISETVKNMLNNGGEQSVGKAYWIPRATVLESLCAKDPYAQCQVTSGENTYDFDFADAYLYVFHTRIAFLCLGLTFSCMETLYTICNPGFAQNDSQFVWKDEDGNTHPFSMDLWLEGMFSKWKLRRFYSSSMLLESYTYILAVTDTPFASTEQLNRITYNLHCMQDPGEPIVDDSEADVRYVCAVKNAAINGYRWGCCVTSQTIAYAVAHTDGEPDLLQEMDTQAADGLPIVLLALYEKYTCLRFTELIVGSESRKLRTILELKKLMLKFQAFGVVPPANLSRWDNVKRIYAYLLEVGEIGAAIQDISSKIDILVEQQQDIDQQRSSRVINLITIFGIVGIVSSVQSIAQILSDGSDLMWSITGLTMALMALCFGLAMKK